MVQGVRMKKLWIIGMLCFLSLWGTGYGAEKQTLAVLYFENNSLVDKDALEPLRKGLADMLITELSHIEAFNVVERAKLQSLMEEMALGMSGAVDLATAQEAGKLLGAQTILFGSFAKGFDKKIRLDVRIVETETGRTIKAEEITDKPKKLFKMVRRLTERIAQNLDVELTKADKKRMGTGGSSFDAALYYAKGLDLHDKGELQQALKMYQKALAADRKFEAAKKKIAEIEAAME